MKKKMLKKSIKEKCMVEIKTSNQVDDYMDVNLNIKFLEGTLKGMKYNFSIDLKDHHMV